MKLEIKGMMCAHCVKRVESALKELGATEIKVEIGKAEFVGVDEKTAKQEIEDLGFLVV